MKNDRCAVLGIAAVRGVCVGRNQVHRHLDLWHGLRGLCTRRARVIEVSFGRGFS